MQLLQSKRTNHENQRKTIGKTMNKESPEYCRKVYWTKMARNGQNDHLVKMTFFRTGFWYSRDQNGPKWSILVHFGPKRSILVHLGPPTVLWPLLNDNRMAQEPNRNRKPEPLEPFFPKPKEEPEPQEPFSRTETGTGTVLFLLNCTGTQKNPFCRRTAGTENRNRSNRSTPKP